MRLFTKKQSEGGENNSLLICDICDERVEIAEKQDGEGAGSIWVCNKCDIKYPKG